MQGGRPPGHSSPIPSGRGPEAPPLFCRVRNAQRQRDESQRGEAQRRARENADAPGPPDFIITSSDGRKTNEFLLENLLFSTPRPVAANFKALQTSPNVFTFGPVWEREPKPVLLPEHGASGGARLRGKSSFSPPS